jgi:hypothetical protein
LKGTNNSFDRYFAVAGKTDADKSGGRLIYYFYVTGRLPIIGFPNQARARGNWKAAAIKDFLLIAHVCLGQKAGKSVKVPAFC